MIIRDFHISTPEYENIDVDECNDATLPWKRYQKSCQADTVPQSSSSDELPIINTRTRIEVSGQLLDAKTGKYVALFGCEIGVTGASMGWLKEVFIELSGDLGGDLAEFVEKLYYPGRSYSL